MYQSVFNIVNTQEIEVIIKTITIGSISISSSSSSTSSSSNSSSSSSSSKNYQLKPIDYKTQSMKLEFQDLNTPSTAS